MTPVDDTLSEQLQRSIDTVRDLQAITRADRCDAGTGCASSAAWIRLTLKRFTLDFCRHHYTVHAKALDAGGWLIHDTVPELK